MLRPLSFFLLVSLSGREGSGHRHPAKTCRHTAKRVSRFKRSACRTPHTQVYRSATDVAVTAYEPKRCETLRAKLPIRGARGISVWIQWEVEMATIRRKRELLRRLTEVKKVSQSVLSLCISLRLWRRFKRLHRLINALFGAAFLEHENGVFLPSSQYHGKMPVYRRG